MSTADEVDRAIRKALAELRTSRHGDPVACAQAARAGLVAVLGDATRAGGCAVPRQVLACADAACEHLEYGELQEARTLLTAARGQLARNTRSGEPLPLGGAAGG